MLDLFDLGFMYSKNETEGIRKMGMPRTANQDLLSMIINSKSNYQSYRI